MNMSVVCPYNKHFVGLVLRVKESLLLVCWPNGTKQWVDRNAVEFV